MSARQFEAFLARIYVDASAREAFRANPRSEALRAGLSPEECAAVEEMDWIDLEIAARSFAHKRRSKLARNRPQTLISRAQHFVAVLWRRIHSSQ